ncbi:unnamed protein product [Clonostachys rosea f. rosea IK726]|uniref:Uncharacterized protein n=1 Tax=Clonostachys rosea f. rosea IK726 TaxID=1349383 RepID=A0ACA9U6B2_BIOOC|nr:unnamed protein product [Clonostachys rosea f. rosea IK726]
MWSETGWLRFCITRDVAVPFHIERGRVYFGSLLPAFCAHIYNEIACTIPYEKPVRVPIDEIRRTLEDLNSRRTGNGAGGRSGPPYSIISNSSAYQSTYRLRQESVRVPLDEIRTTLEDLDRRHAERYTLRRQESQKTEAKPRKEPTIWIDNTPTH